LLAFEAPEIRFLLKVGEGPFSRFSSLGLPACEYEHSREQPVGGGVAACCLDLLKELVSSA
jgi:hypothetical protein